jgi:hypothetical protein
MGKDGDDTMFNRVGGSEVLINKKKENYRKKMVGFETENSSSGK